jgi:hypothetical protein
MHVYLSTRLQQHSKGLHVLRGVSEAGSPGFAVVDGHSHSMEQHAYQPAHLCPAGA